MQCPPAEGLAQLQKVGAATGAPSPRVRYHPPRLPAQALDQAGENQAAFGLGEPQCCWNAWQSLSRTQDRGLWMGRVPSPAGVQSGLVRLSASDGAALLSQLQDLLWLRSHQGRTCSIRARLFLRSVRVGDRSGSECRAEFGGAGGRGVNGDPKNAWWRGCKTRATPARFGAAGTHPQQCRSHKCASLGERYTTRIVLKCRPNSKRSRTSRTSRTSPRRGMAPPLPALFPPSACPTVNGSTRPTSSRWPRRSMEAAWGKFSRRPKRMGG